MRSSLTTFAQVSDLTAQVITRINPNVAKKVNSTRSSHIYVHDPEIHAECGEILLC